MDQLNEGTGFCLQNFGSRKKYSPRWLRGAQTSKSPITCRLFLLVNGKEIDD